MNISFRLRPLVLAFLLSVVTGTAVAQAGTTITVKENDTLSAIVQSAYPQFRNRNAIMQLILQRNPQAFRSGDINFLIIGRELQLPDTGELTELGLSPVQAPSQLSQTAKVEPDPELAQRLQRIVMEKDQLQKQLQQLESENQLLRDNITRLEKLKEQQDEQIQQLEQRLQALQATLEQQQAQQPSVDNTQVADNEASAALTETREQLTQLQSRFETSEQQRRELQNRFETSEQQRQELQTQLTGLQQQQTQGVVDAETGEDAGTAADLQAAQNQLMISEADLKILRADNEQLVADLQAAKDQLILGESDLETLRTELDVLDKQNVVLQTEIDQIKAAAAKDVTLAPAGASEQSWTSLGLWLLMLLLLPVAWLLGQRSRPAPAVASSSALVSSTDTAAKPTVVSDPVAPDPQVADDLSGTGFGSGAAVIPDDPDVAIKLDMARAYLDLRDAEAANDVLQEVIREGGSAQQQEAREILSFIS
ncbi:MAG: hypothetical protein CSA79_00630 [Thiothrix nivea]|nr:MAG: hypothetical protein CSA79_00630 [Thiothrix nivea]